jgi:hypothetical protein
VKAYITCWSAGYHTQDAFNYNLYQLSAYYLKKNHGGANLITDTRGAGYLEGIEFNSVDTSLDSLPTEMGSVIWSLGKIAAYGVIAEKGEPFIHVDNDVFLMKPLPDELLKSRAFAQHKETQVTGPWELDRYHRELPTKGELAFYQTHDAANMGLFGGTDLDFVNRYSRDACALALDRQNLEYIRRTQNRHSWSVATLYEQYYVTIKAMAEGFELDYLFKTEDELETKAVELGYTHLLGAKTPKRQELHDKIYTILYYLGLKPRGKAPWDKVAIPPA